MGMGGKDLARDALNQRAEGYRDMVFRWYERRCLYKIELEVDGVAPVANQDLRSYPSALHTDVEECR